MVFQEINNTIDTIKNLTISTERKLELQPFIDFIQEKVSGGKNVNLNFICTHNSRRSHLSQVWAQVAAYYYNVKNVHCYSGGTEATAMFPMAAQTLASAGFHIVKLSEESNPVYSIKYAENEHPIIGFSKTYDNSFNPKSEFAAIMTCNNADVGCPFIPGADARIPVKYNDPKAFDNTPQQAEKYKERSNQIASEMLYVFSQIK
ncbi:protein-tyrosine-phosphatase [Lutibacter sp. HS1-25]|uniref:arsenate-mycothiol transferase ArsC n=1 Tax=Lutibacter sp. HS1-25 TaxID=2485000 RepID=UPI0010124277|nr:protein-tyrosine-phosphatase [Lutibacter sp. HS1-25]RXP61366.1 protein-tyrosine-phosphatase [Lutibacter sp. HS1-25]